MYDFPSFGMAGEKKDLKVIISLFSANDFELHIGYIVFCCLPALILYCSIKEMFLLFPTDSYT